MNCAPAKGCVWPVLAPARAWVRAGERRSNSECGMRNWGAGLSASGLAALARRFVSVHARRCGSVVAFCRRFASGLDVLLERFAIDSRPALRFWRGGLPSVHACCLSRDKQDGLRYIAFLFRGSRSPFARSRGVGAVIWLGRFTSGLAVYLWRSRQGYRSTGNGADGAAFVRFCAATSALICFPRGVRWGLRAPKPAPKSLRLSGLSSGAGRAAECALRGGVGLVPIRAAVARAHGKT